MKVKSESEVAQSCPTLCDPMDCSPPRLLRPWDFPGKRTGVGCHCLLRQQILASSHRSSLFAAVVVITAVAHGGGAATLLSPCSSLPLFNKRGAETKNMPAGMMQETLSWMMSDSDKGEVLCVSWDSGTMLEEGI